MRSTFGGMEIAKRSLFAQQAALQTTGHNIANANTVGYTRQTVHFVASRPMEAVGWMRSNVPGQIGQGVEFDQITRIREKFLDSQYYNENQYLGEWAARSNTLEKLEAIVNEPSDTGIRQTIEGFWNAWQTLSKEPENVTARAALKEKALALTDSFNHAGKQLRELSEDLTNSIDVVSTEANTILKQIASLNNEIFRVEGLGNNANDLRDQRDLLMDNLSQIVNVTAVETESGYTVKMGDTELVNGINVTATFDREFVAAQAASGQLRSGEIKGLLVSRDDYLASYRFQLDAMVKSLVQGKVTVTLPKGTVVPEGTVIGNKTYKGSIEERTLNADDPQARTISVNGINGLHQLGYTLEDPPQTGIPFFTLKEGATEFSAESITLNPEIEKKVANIAASLRVEADADGNVKVIRGNNDAALLLAGLRNQKFDFDPTSAGTPLLTSGTFDEFFRAMVGQLGVQGREADRQLTNQQILVDQVESRRQSVSGVSLDEEMSNMIKFQHAYNAAARAMTTFDEMLDKVINSMGVVGR